jgi:recombination protein RecR
MLPKALLRLIEKLERLPGVGRKTAERYAYELLRGSKQSAKEIAKSLDSLHENVMYCPKTFALIEADQVVSPLYDDPSRDKSVVAVVAQPLDVVAIENTGKYKGTYHVLKGLLSPIDGVAPNDLTIDQLIKRVSEDGVNEIILATSGSVEGESTALYIQKHLANTAVKVTRLARGLPVGLDIEFADQITLSQALQGRRPVDSE